MTSSRLPRFLDEFLDDLGGMVVGKAQFLRDDRGGAEGARVVDDSQAGMEGEDMDSGMFSKPGMKRSPRLKLVTEYQYTAGKQLNNRKKVKS